MKSHGELTAQLGEYLREIYGPLGLDVLHDHGQVPGKDQQRVGKIVSWYGGTGLPERNTELSQLDIAIVQPGVQRALVLIEIEETNSRPKTLLGDAFAALLGSQVAYQRYRLEVGPWTTFIIMVRGSEDHRVRNSFLVEQMDIARRSLKTGNSSIGKIIIENFYDEELEQKTRGLIDLAIEDAALIAKDWAE